MVTVQCVEPQLSEGDRGLKTSKLKLLLRYFCFSSSAARLVVRIGC